MKHKKTLISFFLALFVIIFAFLSVSFFVIKPITLLKVEERITDVLNNNSDFSVTVGKLDRHFLNYIELSNVKIKQNDTEIATVSGVRISEGLFGIFKFIKAKDVFSLNIEIYGAHFNINQNLIDYVSSLGKKENKGNSGEFQFAESSETNISVSSVRNDEQKKEFDIKKNSLKKSMGALNVNITLKDFTALADLKKVSVSAMQKNTLKAKIFTDLTTVELQSFNSRFSGVTVLLFSDDTEGKPKRSQRIEIEDTTLYADKNYRLKQNTKQANIYIDDKIKFSVLNIDSLSELENKNLSGTMNIGKVLAEFNVNTFSDMNFSETDLSETNVLYANLTETNASDKNREFETNVSVGKIKLSYNSNIKNIVNSYAVSLSTDKIDYNDKNNRINIRKAGLSAEYDRDKKANNVFLYSDEIGVDSLFVSKGKENRISAGMRNIVSSVLFTDNYDLSVVFHCFAFAETEYKGFENISSEVDFKAEISDLKNIEKSINGVKNVLSAELELKNLKLPLLTGSNNIRASLKDGDVFRAEINTECGINSVVNYVFSTGVSDIKLYYNRFKLNILLPYVEKIPEKIKNSIDDNTELDGSFVLNGKIKKTDINGQTSVNLAVSGLKIGSKRQAIATSVEAVAKNNILSISSFALSGFGYRLSYSGNIDLNTFFPEGGLLLQNSETGAVIARTNFTLDDNSLGYSIESFLEKKKDSYFSTHIKWDRENNFESAAVLKTKYGSYDFNGVYNREANTVDIRSDGFNAFFNIDVKSGLVNGTITLKDFVVHISKDQIIKANAEISGLHNLSEGTFLYECNNFEFVFSDIFSFGFNIAVSEKNLILDSLYVNARDVHMIFDGKAKIDYPDFAEILTDNTENLHVDVDFRRIDSNDYLKVTVIRDRYSIKAFFSQDFPFEVSLLGSRGNGFFAVCKSGNVSFEAKYKEKNILFYNGKGNVGKLDIAEFGFNVDFVKRTFTGSVELERVLSDNTKQGCTVALNAKLDSLVLGALSMAGLNVEASFVLSLSNARLGDRFNPKDVEASIVFNNEMLTVSSALINGKYLFKDKYIDLKIDKDFFVGFHARGYVNDEVDLYVEDLYLPIGILDQFSSSSVYQSYNGVVEGKILIKGSAFNPSFYGTLYIQTLEIGLFYLPNQILVARDIVLNVYEHSFMIKDVPIVGTSSEDGRFYTGFMNIEFEVNELSFDNFLLHLGINEKPLDLRIVMSRGKVPLNIRGDVLGSLDFWYKGGRVGMDADITAENTTISFDLEGLSERSRKINLNCDFNIILRTGRNVEIYYPSVVDSFINIMLEENEVLSVKYEKATNNILADSNLKIKSGRISYINNDFTIREGTVKFEKTAFQRDINLNVNLVATLKEYDTDGKQIDISLILRNATMDNLQPHFESVPAKTENEIVNLLGQSVLPGAGEDITLGSIANAAAIATNTMADLGIINKNRNYNVGAVVRDSLSLDILSLRSPLVQNIIINSIPGTSSKNSLLARYLNGTTLFAGKYINKNLFAKLTFMLRQASKKTGAFNYGHFLTEDLNLNLEFSIDFDNPIGSFSIFVQPPELSILSFLDNIGFSFTKRITF